MIRLPNSLHRDIGCPLPKNNTRYSVVQNKPYLCKTNSLGFRSDFDYIDNRPPKTKRVILFGDSFVDGHNIANEFRFSDRIKIADLEIQNYAVGGTGADQQYLIYREYCKNVQSDLLILAPTDVDIIRNMVDKSIVISITGRSFGVSKPRFQLTENSLQLIPRDLDIPPVYDWNYPEDAHYGSATNWLPQYNDCNSSGWKLMHAIITEWIKSYPGQVLLMPLPSWFFISKQSDSCEYQARWHELADDLSVPIFDLLQYFLDLPDVLKKASVLPDSHYSCFGHGLIAEWIEPYIKKVLGD